MKKFKQFLKENINTYDIVKKFGHVIDYIKFL